MIRRIIKLFARTRGGSRTSGLVYATVALAAYDALTSRTGKQELVDISHLKPGETIVIQSLDVSHKEQIKQEKRDHKQDKRAVKQAEREAKVARKEAKAARKEARAARRRSEG